MCFASGVAPRGLSQLGWAFQCADLRAGLGMKVACCCESSLLCTLLGSLGGLHLWQLPMALACVMPKGAPVPWVETPLRSVKCTGCRPDCGMPTVRAAPMPSGMQVLGMKLLRTRDNPEHKYKLAFVGYGELHGQAIHAFGPLGRGGHLLSVHD